MPSFTISTIDLEGCIPEQKRCRFFYSRNLCPWGNYAICPYFSYFCTYRKNPRLKRVQFKIGEKEKETKCQYT